MQNRTENTENIENPEKKDNFSEALRLDHNLRELRREIGLVADQAFRQHFISQEAFEGYQGHNLEPHTDEKFLKGMLKFAREDFDKAKDRLAKLEGMIDEGVRTKIASEKDREFLLAHLILTGEHNLTEKADEAEKILSEKIGRMKKDKNEYDTIAQNPLARNTGFLKTDASTKLSVPKEEEFLKMTVPERRAWLKKAKDALPKAKEYAEKTGQVESKELTQKYEGLLKGALARKIIGKKTYEKFLDGFKKIDKAEKESWVKEFPNQMKRYEKLWSDIRKTLKGDPLVRMEAMRDTKGYTELFTEFGRTCEQEGKKIDGQYEKRLHHFWKEEKIIGRHTVNEFMDAEDGIRKQDLHGKTKYLEQLDGQMQRYRDLWKEAEKLPEKEQAYLESKREDWGYAQLHEQFVRFKNGAKAPETAQRDPLSIVTNTSVKRAILETNERLGKEGGEKRKSFLHRIKLMFTGEQKDSFDAKGFQARLHQDRVEKDKEEKGTIRVEGRNSSNAFELQQNLRKQQAPNKEAESMDEGAIRKEMEKAGADGLSHSINLEGFQQVEKDEEGHTRRTAQVTINREKGMDRFLFEDQQNRFRGKKEGGKDDLSLSARTDDGRTVELNLTEIRAMEKFLEEEEKEKAA